MMMQKQMQWKEVKREVGGGMREDSSFEKRDRREATKRIRTWRIQDEMK
jgi:hypothetical protein